MADVRSAQLLSTLRMGRSGEFRRVRRFNYGRGWRTRFIVMSRKPSALSERYGFQLRTWSRALDSGQVLTRTHVH
jgi:hypothetical protein